MEMKPLVSVVVITYNSALTLLETLESIRQQTYPSIEVVISDDGSTDETLEVAAGWIEKNRNDFVRCALITSEMNTGITKNCNRGVRAAEGEYVKLVAGDDFLLSNCIDDLISYCLAENTPVAFSKVLVKAEENNVNLKRIRTRERLFIYFFKMNQRKQYKAMLTGFKAGFYLIGSIFSKALYLSIGGFDEKYLMMEDYPFYYRISSLGYYLPLLDKYTVVYRVRNSKNRDGFKKSRRYIQWYEDLERFQKTELLPEMYEKRMFLGIYDLCLKRLSINIESRYNCGLSMYVAKLVRGLSPIAVFGRIRIFLDAIVDRILLHL